MKHPFWCVISPQTESLIGLHFIYGFSALTLILVTFGGLGAKKEKMWALIVVSKEKHTCIGKPHTAAAQL